MMPGGPDSPEWERSALGRFGDLRASASKFDANAHAGRWTTEPGRKAKGRPVGPPLWARASSSELLFRLRRLMRGKGREYCIAAFGIDRAIGELFVQLVVQTIERQFEPVRDAKLVIY